jgi:hypothetical protein
LYSYVASAWITLIAYVLMVALSYVWGQKHYPIPYHVSKNLVYIGLGVVVCMGMHFLLPGLWVWKNVLWAAMIAGILSLEWKGLKAILQKGI